MLGEMTSWRVALACTRCNAPGKLIDAQLIAICESDQRGLVAVNQLLPPLAGGYLPAPSDAASFLRSIDEPLDPIRAGIALHRMSESDPDKAAF